MFEGETRPRTVEEMLAKEEGGYTRPFFLLNCMNCTNTQWLDAYMMALVVTLEERDKKDGGLRDE
ncbi:hypothetical protein [Microbulbifer sp. JSM ZJ756]|uniref:hypothetical protein n=1 Tax=Microbulbifer sp. JSM ZJ756 TaxID=3376191 RepID=UPI0037B69E71